MNRVNHIEAPSAPKETKNIELTPVGRHKEQPSILSYIPSSYLHDYDMVTQSRPIIQVTILGKTRGALLDTGSEISYCSRALGVDCLQEGGTLIKLEKPIYATLANKTTIIFSSMFVYEVEVEKSESVKVDMLLMDEWINNDFDIILGINFMRKMSKQLNKAIGFNFFTKEIKIGDQNFEMSDSNHYNPKPINVIYKKNSNGILPKIEIKINNNNFTALVDTGSSITYCRASTARKFHGGQVKFEKMNGIAANGSNISFFGSVEARVELAGIILCGKILISNDNDCPFEVIIGTDLLESINKQGNDITFDFFGKKISFGKSVEPIINFMQISDDVFLDKNDELIDVVSTEDYIIEPHSDTLIKGEISDEHISLEKSCFITLGANNLPMHLVVGRTISIPCNGIFVRILNMG